MTGRSRLKLECRAGPPIGTKASIGLIVLQADETLEPEMQRFLNIDGLALYVSRIKSGAKVTNETLASMATNLPAAASLLPPSVGFDAIAYCCTSAATVIGPDRVDQLIRSAITTRAVTNPLTALLAALNALAASRLAFVTPYVEDVSAAMGAMLESAGVEIVASGSFMEAEEAKVARIDRRSVIDAALAVGRMARCDAVFLSCTNLRTIDAIDEIEAELGVPVISSNQALAWHLLQLAGIPHPDSSVGLLFR